MKRVNPGSVTVDPAVEAAVPDLPDDEYDVLRQSIDLHGQLTPVMLDRDGVLIDGHHRLRACEELGDDVLAVEEDVEATPELALRLNLARRQADAGTKREIVKDYLTEHYEGTRTQQKIADDLGVNQATVSRAFEELAAAGKNMQVHKFTTEEKRRMVREYIDAYPDASNREVADAVECDVSYGTVRNWRNEEAEPTDDDEEDDADVDEPTGPEPTPTPAPSTTPAPTEPAPDADDEDEDVAKPDDDTLPVEPFTPTGDEGGGVEIPEGEIDRLRKRLGEIEERKEAYRNDPLIAERERVTMSFFHVGSALNHLNTVAVCPECGEGEPHDVAWVCDGRHEPIPLTEAQERNLERVDELTEEIDAPDVGAGGD